MRYHLLVDADDTLWENNIYFEQAIHSFISFLDHSQLSPAEVRAVLDEVERLMGYGSANFTRSLNGCCGTCSSLPPKITRWLWREITRCGSRAGADSSVERSIAKPTAFLPRQPSIGMTEIAASTKRVSSSAAIAGAITVMGTDRATERIRPIIPG